MKLRKSRKVHISDAQDYISWYCLYLLIKVVQQTESTELESEGNSIVFDLLVLDQNEIGEYFPISLSRNFLIVKLATITYI